jgi:dihydrofolate synthase/folylpolyglutamate synthase
MYQRTGKAAYKADLQNTLDLDKYLDHPHIFYRTIHIAGTNGKGSTSHMIASILQEAGYKVGLYTSPHLNDFRERIRVNGELCEEQFVTDFVNRHKQFFKDHKLSFFEMTVGMAFQYFKEQKVDIAVVETGLGGRLDSTNIITPIVTAITNIDKDHTAILGNTFIKIAGEKAGIIKKNIPIVIG